MALPPVAGAELVSFGRSRRKAVNRGSWVVCRVALLAERRVVCALIPPSRSTPASADPRVLGRADFDLQRVKSYRHVSSPVTCSHLLLFFPASWHG